MDFQEHLKRQIAWSRATFGPGPRTAGVIDHIRKELVEIETATTPEERAKEWTDIVILGLDGLWRSLSNDEGMVPTDMIAELVVNHILHKQAKNELRNWPDWRTAPADKAIEHVRAAGEGGGRVYCSEGSRFVGMTVDEIETAVKEEARDG